MKQYLSDCIIYLKTNHSDALLRTSYNPHSTNIVFGFINTVMKSMGLLFVSQNPVEAPKRDYSVLPLLAAPPQVGERIAFKVKNL